MTGNTFIFCRYVINDASLNNKITYIVTVVGSATSCDNNSVRSSYSTAARLTHEQDEVRKLRGRTIISGSGDHARCHEKPHAINHVNVITVCLLHWPERRGNKLCPSNNDDEGST
jgi:hypothetical protein